MNFPFYIARRYLFSKKSRNVINIITGISMFVVTGIAAAMIIVLSALNGIEQLVQDLFNNFETEITIEPARGKTFEIPDSTYAFIQEMPAVAHSSKIIEEDVWVRNHVKDVNTVCTIKGVDSDYREMTGLDSMIEAGSFLLEDEDYYYAVLGAGVYHELQVAMRDDGHTTLFVNAPIRGKKIKQSKENAFKSLPILIKGVYSVSVEWDVKYIYTHIDFCRELFDYKNEISSIEVKLKEGYDSMEYKKELSAYLPENLVIKTREERNALVYKTNESEKWATMVILFFILIISAFNIVASLSMLIIEKKKDIHSLRSMGATDDTIKKIFVLEGILIYFIGAIAGILLGLLVCWAQQKFGLIEIKGARVPYYPVKVMLSDLLIVLGSVMLVGLLLSRVLVQRLLKRFV